MATSLNSDHLEKDNNNSNWNDSVNPYNAYMAPSYYSYGFPSQQVPPYVAQPPLSQSPINPDNNNFLNQTSNPYTNYPSNQASNQSSNFPSSLKNHHLEKEPVYYNPDPSVMNSTVNPDHGNPDHPNQYYKTIVLAHFKSQKPKTKYPTWFLFKVYTILLIQLAITGGLIAANYFIYTPPNFFLPIFITTFILSMITLMILFCVRKVLILNVIVLTIFTVLFGWCIGTIASQYKIYFVLQAIIVTFCVTFFISIIVIITRAKLMWMGNLLCSMLFVLFFASLFGVLFSFVLRISPWWEILISAFAAIIFSMFIAYDTSMMIHRYYDNEAILASVNLYLDIVNLFLALLSLSGGITGSGSRR